MSEQIPSFVSLHGTGPFLCQDQDYQGAQDRRTYYIIEWTLGQWLQIWRRAMPCTRVLPTRDGMLPRDAEFCPGGPFTYNGCHRWSRRRCDPDGAGQFSHLDVWSYDGPDRTSTQRRGDGGPR